jgi:hypothetical protein
MERRNEDDWPVLATALALNCPIWTEDADFFLNHSRLAPYRSNITPADGITGNIRPSRTVAAPVVPLYPPKLSYR